MHLHVGTVTTATDIGMAGPSECEQSIKPLSSLLGRCGVTESGSHALACIGGEGELRYQQQAAAGIGKRTIHSAISISEHPIAKQALHHALCVGLGVVGLHGDQRQQAAPKLSQAVTDTMQTLGLQGGRFEVALAKLEEPQAHGWEQVEFLVAGHAGVTARPVGKVASGGELSRIALAISVVTSQLGQAPTLIFDEVDSGIGGAVAHTVGQLLRQLGRDRQVLAVTHLPQVAACADQHLLVSKQQAGQHTLSHVAAIDQEARVLELARMLGGSAQSEVSLAHARELLAT